MYLVVGDQLSLTECLYIWIDMLSFVKYQVSSVDCSGIVQHCVELNLPCLIGQHFYVVDCYRNHQSDEIRRWVQLKTLVQVLWSQCWWNKVHVLRNREHSLMWIVHKWDHLPLSGAMPASLQIDNRRWYWHKGQSDSSFKIQSPHRHPPVTPFLINGGLYCGKLKFRNSKGNSKYRKFSNKGTPLFSVGPGQK